MPSFASIALVLVESEEHKDGSAAGRTHPSKVKSVLAKYDIAELPEDFYATGTEHVSGEEIGWTHKICRELLDVALEYPGLKVLVNALGTPPDDILAPTMRSKLRLAR